jgi:membrane protease YdiL (CAAX protease family)
MPETESTPIAPQPGPASLATVRRSIFIGSQGLRAGWRLLVFVLLVVALGGAASVVLRKFAGSMGTDFSIGNVVLSELVQFGIVLIASLLMGRFERRTIGDYGLPFRLAFQRQFWTGALWGFAMLSIIVALMAATRVYSTGAIVLAPTMALEYGVGWAAAFLLVGFFEEFALRGYPQFTLTTGLGFWPAAVITSILFASGHLHNEGENLVGVFEIVLIALFLCLALRRTGNLWFAIGWHMAFDWGESYFYSTPNSGIHAVGHLFNASLTGSKWLSGGTVGPEASVFDLIVTVAGIFLLAKVYPQAKYPALRAGGKAVAPEASPSVSQIPSANG